MSYGAETGILLFVFDVTLGISLLVLPWFDIQHARSCFVTFKKWLVVASMSPYS